MGHGPKHFPKIWHAIWLGSVLPDKFQENIKTWIKHNPGYQFNLWIDSATLPLSPKSDEIYDPDIPSNAIPAMQKFCKENGICLRDMAEIAKRIPVVAQFLAEPFYNDWVNGNDRCYAFASEVLRLVILYVYGGIYTDTDTVCYGSIGELLANDPGLYFFGIDDASEQRFILDNWLIAASKHNLAMFIQLKAMRQAYINTIICARENKIRAQPSEIPYDPKREEKLFAEPLLRFPEFNAVMPNVGAENKHYSTDNGSCPTTYNLLRKICPHNLDYKVRYFGFVFFLYVMTKYVRENFGLHGLKAVVFPNRNLKHYEAKSWQQKQYSPIVELSNENGMSKSLARLRGAPA